MDGASNCEGLLLSCGESLVAMVTSWLQSALEKNKRRDLVDILLLQLIFVPLNGLACPSRRFTTTAATATAAMARRVIIVVGSSQQQQWQTATARQVVVTRTCNLTDYFILFYSILFYHNKQLTPDLGNVCLLLVKGAAMGFHDFVDMLLNFLERQSSTMIKFCDLLWWLAF
jgi:hypothetical protein